MAQFGSAVNSGHYDANQNASIIGVIGTLGTADISGTAQTLPIGVQKDTGAVYVWIAGTDVNTGGGAGGGSMVNVVTGTQQTLGTVGVLNTGTINALASGTITGGTLQNLVSGTVNALASGTITGGTLGNLVSGTITSLTTGSLSNVAMLNAGTLTALGIGTILKSSPAALAGSFTAAGSVVVTGSQYDAASFDLQGTWVGTTFFEGQIGTSSWFSISALNAAGVALGSATANGDYFVDMSSLDGVRARLTYSSGTQTYNARASAFESNSMSLVGGSVNTLTNLTNGSVILQSGTLTTGTLQNLVSGTINALAAGTVTAGTLTNLVSGTINALAAGTITGGTLTNLVSGTINALAAGTVTAGTLTNLVSGTINALAAGTITGGTLGNLNYGTVATDTKPVKTGTYSVTVGTTGAAVWGTLISSVGAGKKIYLAGLDIAVVSGTVEVAVTNNVAGSTGTGVFTRGNFIAGGGISKNFNPVLFTGTGGTLAYWLGGAGTVDFSYQYWVGA